MRPVSPTSASARFRQRSITRRPRHGSVDAGFGFSVRAAVDAAASCISAWAGSHAAVASGCGINRSRWIRWTERCTPWAKSPGKSIRKREWICQTNRPACTGAVTIERFEHQSNVWTIATMRRLGVFLPRLRRGSKGDWLKIWRNCGRSPVFSPRTNPMDYSANAWRTPA